MKHKPFEEWIFSDDEISPSSRKALYDHLRDCDPCYLLDKNWRAVETLIQDAPSAVPLEGFASRWEARLAVEQKRTADRQSIAMLLVTSLTAWMFLILFGYQLLSRMPEGFNPVAAVLARAGQVLPLVQAFLGELVMRAGFVQPVLPVFATMGFFAVIGAAGILWLKMFRMLARVQGLQQWA